MESKLYNPAQLPKEWLIDRFIVRTKVFDKIFKDILNGTMQYPEQHYLIQGQRGMGKTTLLLRLKYEIENTPQLNEWLVPVFFNEESYDLTSLSNLWEKLLKYLDNLWATGGRYYKQTDKFVGLDDYERKCFDLLESILKERNKKLIIFFDNFGQLFLDNLGEMETHRFREILMNNNSFRIIGATAIVLHDLHDYSKPFFDFFKVINLEGLSVKETILLIDKLQARSGLGIDVKKNKARIETLAVMTGGVIRTIMLIYEVLFIDQNGSAIRDLENILDKITPLYKHRMEDLPVQQRKIIDVIAKRWDAMSTKEIAENIRENGKPLSSKLISAQLQQLEKNNIINKKNTGGKNHLYQLRERFFNIWYLMRNGDRTDRRRVIWLTKFLESWYDNKAAINGFINQHIERLKTGNYYADAAIMIAEALSHSKQVDVDVHDQLIRATGEILNKDQRRLLPKSGKQLLEQAQALYSAGDFNGVVDKLTTVNLHSMQMNLLLCNSYIRLKQPERALKAVSSDNIYNAVIKGTSLQLIGKTKEAIDTFKEGLNKYDNKHINKIIAYMLGVIYETVLENEDLALNYFRIAAELNSHEAKFKIATIYENKLDFNAAEQVYLNLLQEDNLEAAFELLQLYILKMNEKDRATKLLEELLPRYPNDLNLQVIEAMLNVSQGKFNIGLEMFIRLQNEFISETRFDLAYEISTIFISSTYINDKEKNKAIAQLTALEKTDAYPMKIIQATVLLWDNKFDASFKSANSMFGFKGNETGYESLEETYILMLLAKKQYHFAKKLFDHPELQYKDKFKPIYYALLSYMADEYPNELLRMGEELEQPVASVKERVEVMREEYK